MSEPQNTNESPVREGDVLAGKYLVEKVLGVGGMGVVVAAMHTELEERVALKFLLPSAAQNPAVVARFAREARAAAKIKSQHVARVIDVGTLETGVPYIVMEYLEGKDLSDILVRDGRLPVSLAVGYVLQAGEAIAEAHAAGFVHRDLKPPNLFLAHQSDGTDIIKVLDFGISKAVLVDEPTHRGALTGTADVFGSPMYMSPEQLKSARDVDARADIWALGVILYELMSGKAPFDRPTVAETFGSILHEQPVPLRKVCPDVPEELERIVMRCLDKDKDKRAANVAELSKALFPFAPSASRASLDRTSRVLRRAGVQIDSIPPPPMPSAPVVVVGDGGGSHLSAQAQTSAPAVAQTRTAWDTVGQVTQATQATRSSAKVTLALGLLVGALLSAGVGVLATRRLQHLSPPVVLSVQADHPADGPKATPDDRPPVAPAVTPSAAPEATPTAAVTVAPAAATTVAPVATVAAVATGTPGTLGASPNVVVSPGAALGPKGKGRGGRWGAPAAGTSPGAPAPGMPISAAKPKAPEPDDFGDRK
jgi:eukaryotic-like serine/threonine-protein kinase